MFSSWLGPDSRGLVCLLAIATVPLSACKDTAKASEQKAIHWAGEVSHRATEDVGEIQRGLPLGATSLEPLYTHGADPAADLVAVRRSLVRVRANIPDLARSNATFFALADAHGIAIRNDLEQDVMAGQDVWKLFPDLQKTKEGKFVSATGLFGGARAPGEPDRDWVAAAPLKDEQGELKGMLLTGWTLRRFAYHLQESLRHDLIEEQAKTKDPGNLPIVYVSVFDPSGLYSAPMTPTVNEKAIVDLGLVGLTATGVAHGVLSITDRDFGYAAQRVPALEPDAGVIVLWSEI